MVVWCGGGGAGRKRQLSVRRGVVRSVTSLFICCFLQTSFFFGFSVAFFHFFCDNNAATSDFGVLYGHCAIFIWDGIICGTVEFCISLHLRAQSIVDTERSRLRRRHRPHPPPARHLHSAPIQKQPRTRPSSPPRRIIQQRKGFARAHHPLRKPHARAHPPPLSLTPLLTCPEDRCASRGHFRWRGWCTITHPSPPV